MVNIFPVRGPIGQLSEESESRSGACPDVRAVLGGGTKRGFFLLVSTFEFAAFGVTMPIS
jgi:hypothetical protein